MGRFNQALGEELLREIEAPVITSEMKRARLQGYGSAAALGGAVGTSQLIWDDKNGTGMNLLNSTLAGGAVGGSISLGTSMIGKMIYK